MTKNKDTGAEATPKGGEPNTAESLNAGHGSEIHRRLQGSAKRHQKLAIAYIVLALLLAIGGVAYFAAEADNGEAGLLSGLQEWEVKRDALRQELDLLVVQQDELSSIDRFYMIDEGCKPYRLNGSYRLLIDAEGSSDPKNWTLRTSSIKLGALSMWSISAINEVSSPRNLADIIMETCVPQLGPAEVESIAQDYVRDAEASEEQYRGGYGAYNFATKVLNRDHRDFVARLDDRRSYKNKVGTMFSELDKTRSTLENKIRNERDQKNKDLGLLNEEVIAPIKERLKPKEEASQADIVNSVIVRIGSISLALYLLALFLGFARYHTRMANFYEARGHALSTARLLAPDSIQDVLKTLDPEKIMFTKEPNMPLDKLMKIAEAFRK